MNKRIDHRSKGAGLLDDALVYSDDDRIVKMFTALTRVADDQQIPVFHAGSRRSRILAVNGRWWTS